MQRTRKSGQLNIRLEPELRRRLRQRAITEDSSMGHLARKALEEYLARHGNGNKPQEAA